MKTLLNILADEKNSIPYRPAIAIKLKGVTSAILFQQIIFRWCTNEGEFYKFKEPCEHELYRKNDSWTEELGFTADEFDNARSKIAHKYTSKSQSLGFNGKMIRYRVDSSRLTWYDVDPDAVELFLTELYSERFTKTGKVGLRKPEKSVYENRKSPVTTIEHRTLTENTRDNKERDFSSSRTGTVEDKRSKALATVRMIYDEKIIPAFREKTGGEYADIDPQSAITLAQFLEREVDGQSIDHRAELIVGAFVRYCDDKFWQERGLPFRAFVTQMSKYTTNGSIKKAAKRGPHTHGLQLCDDPDCTRTDEEDGYD